MKLAQPVPILRILDEAKALEFYIGFLGFSIDWEHRFGDNTPLYLQVSRDGCVLHLSEHYGDATPGGALRIETNDVEGLNRELLAKHYKYAKPGVEDTPWQTREMSIKDPFGNRLVFSQPLTVPGVDVTPDMTAVGGTARWMAANRALETELADPLYRDPPARQLAGRSGFAMMSAMRAAMGAADTANPDVFLTVRTRFLDDALLAAVRERALTQTVILAAGMDARAFRLDWPTGTVVFEVDRQEIFDYKEPVLERAAVRPTADRRVVRADVMDRWTEALMAAGFDTTRPAAFLVEGLLMYLDAQAGESVIGALSAIAAPGSWLALDVVNQAMLTSPYTTQFMKKLAEAGCPWLSGVDDPESWLAGHGWLATALTPGEEGATYGRIPPSVIPRTLAGVPRVHLVTASRIPTRP